MVKWKTQNPPMASTQCLDAAGPNKKNWRACFWLFAKCFTKHRSKKRGGIVHRLWIVASIPFELHANRFYAIVARFSMTTNDNIHRYWIIIQVLVPFYAIFVQMPSKDFLKRVKLASTQHFFFAIARFLPSFKYGNISIGINFFFLIQLHTH